MGSIPWQEISAKFALTTGAIFGALAFVVLWGLSPLDPFNLQWMFQPYAGDFTFSALAAWAYIRESWAMPPGAINSLVYPAQTSVVFADNVPIAAFLAKTVASLTHADFHYYGLWGFLCAVLQGGISCAILYRYSRNIWLALIGSGFLFLSPFFLGRMFNHVSMGGQWVVLMPILFITYRSHPFIARHEVSLWCVTLIGSVGVMAYFTPIVLGLAVLYYWLRAEESARRAAIRLMVTMVISIPGIFAMLWVGGGLIPGMTSGGADYGAVPLNLAAFIDPGPFSKMLPAFDAGPTELYRGESYAWLGTGVVAGAALLILCLLRTGNLLPSHPWSRTLPYLVVCTVFVAFAATNTLRFGDSVVFSYPLPDVVQKVFSSFRSSARIGWPVWYLIVIAVIGGISALPFSAKTRGLMLAALLTLQIWDGYSFRQVLRNTNAPAVAQPLSSPFWENLAAAGKHLYILPFWGLTSEEVRAQMFVDAVRQRVTTNIYWLGRYPMDAISATFNVKHAGLQGGIREPDDILLFNHVPYLAGMKLPTYTQVYLIDGLAVVAKSGLGNLAAGIHPVTVKTVGFTEYLEQLAERRHRTVILVSGNDAQPSASLDAPSRTALARLGLARLGDATGQFAYAAVLVDGQVVREELEAKQVAFNMPANAANIAGALPVNIDIAVSPGNSAVPVMKVNGTNVVSGIFGVSIAVYDLDKKAIVQRGAFGGYSREPGVSLTVD